MLFGWRRFLLLLVVMLCTADKTMAADDSGIDLSIGSCSAERASSVTQKYQVYPYPGGTKTIHLIRHGEGIHNEAKKQRGRAAYMEPELADARLTEKGHSQAKDLRREMLEEGFLHDVDLVITSPLTRTLETATGIFGKNVSMLAIEEVRERYGTHPCDRRSSVSDLKQKFDHVDFSEVVTDDDTWHTDERETIENLHGRIQRFLEWLENRAEDSIAVVSHHDFLVHFLKVLNAPPELQGRFENCERRSIVLGINSRG